VDEEKKGEVITRQKDKANDHLKNQRRRNLPLAKKKGGLGPLERNQEKKEKTTIVANASK